MKPLLGLFLVASSAIACGDSNPEPKAPETPPSTSSTSETPPTPVASVASASPPPSTVPPDSNPPSTAADAGSSTGPQPKADKNGVPLDSKDECTPVGVDFEKRARPKLKDCYAEGKKKDANLQGTVKIKITIDMKGKIKATKVIEKTLPDPVAACMLKAVQATPFPEVDKCWDSTITIPITFPTPH